MGLHSMWNFGDFYRYMFMFYLSCRCYGRWNLIDYPSVVLRDLLENGKLLMKFRWWNRSSVHHTNDIIHNGKISGGERIENARKQHDVSTMTEQWPRHGNFTIRSARRNTNETCPFSEFKHQQSPSSIYWFIYK